MSTIAEPAVHGPRDMDAVDISMGDAGDRTLLSVSNVLNGTVAASPNVVNEETVIRIDLVSVGSAVPRRSLYRIDHHDRFRISRATRPGRSRNRTNRCGSEF